MADTNKFVQTQKTTLYGSGAGSTDTSIILSSLKLPDGSTNIAMTDFGSIGFGTIEPGTSREEQISFTGITQNANGTATLTGVTRGLRFVSPYDTVTDNKKQHAGGSIFVVTNTAGFYDKLLAKGNDETITGKYTFSTIPESTDTPLADNDLATKAYVDANVNGGDVSINRIIVAGTAGEDVSADTLVYLKAADSRWWKVDADLTATLDSVILGITQGAGTAGNSITGGVLKNGIHTTTGLTANSLYYASNTAGAIATSAGTLTRVIGLAISTTQLHFDPLFFSVVTSNPTSFINSSSGASDAGKGVKTDSNGLIDKSFTTTPTVQNFITKTFGDSTTRFDITNPSGSTFRYTYDSTGTNPDISTSSLPYNSILVVNGQNFSSGNNGTFKVTGVGSNYFEVTNSSGVVESDKTLGTGSITGATTWTKPTGLKYVIVEVQAGGGAGGGAVGSDDAGGGGGGGGYARKLIQASLLGATETVTVGAGGVGGIGSGPSGGNSSFGSHLVSTGGSGGTANNGTAGVGGIGTLGDLNIGGSDGYIGTIDTSGTEIGGHGGDSHLGGGALGGDNSANGSSGKLYGGGGGGAASPSGTDYSGGSGANGIVIVTEFYN